MASGINPNTSLFNARSVYPPSVEDLERISRDFGLKLNVNQVEEFKGCLDSTLRHYNQLDRLVPPQPLVKYPRTSGYQPQPEENKHNAWYWRCDIQGADEGILKDKTVGVKDCISVAGVPMCTGSRILRGFVPLADATVVTRILDSGGRILGKTSADNFCMTTSSWACDLGPILNPYDVTRSSGGSSGGSAVAVLQGDVDIALGTDQGGSIRCPASWCGLVGLKPTWGLVPYTGIGQLEATLDHVGPIARTVTDCALLLEAISGYDNARDPRQDPGIAVPIYSQELTSNIGGMKIGMLTEGFRCAESQVQTVVREAALWLNGAGAHLQDVSVPMHEQGMTVFTPISIEGIFKTLLEFGGQGYLSKGHYSDELIRKMWNGMKTQAHHAPLALKLHILLGEYISRTYGSEFYAKAQNMIPVLKEAYDTVLKEYDVIVMPTTPCTALKLPAEDVSMTDLLNHSNGVTNNTAPFNLTGNPALSINAGFINGLPVGMMIVGKHFDDVTVLKVAYAFEKIRNDIQQK